MTRIVLLTEGHSDPHKGKTAASILRYRGDEVVGIVDSTQNGRTAHDRFGVGGDIPIRADLSTFEADELMIGVAPTGLHFPPAWRRLILDAIERGMNVTNGTHTFLTEDAEFSAAAARKGIKLWDVRTPPAHIGCSRDVARDAAPLRIHTVGMDCSIGKMTVSIEIDREMQKRGVKSRFLATGQTGIMVSGYGLPIDRFIADFVAGGAETLIMENLEYDAVNIEGQGSLFHPLYSGVTLGLLHGCAPDLLILCYHATRQHITGTQRTPPSLAEGVEIFERCANYIHPCKIVGIGANTYGMSEQEARESIERAESETGLPATDVIRYGAAKLVDAIQQTTRPSQPAA